MGFGNQYHHQKAKRPARDRDGQKWPADGGAGISDAQNCGYSESAGNPVTINKGQKPKKVGKGEHHSF